MRYQNMTQQGSNIYLQWVEHYFVETERFASRVGDGNINGLNTHATTNAALVAKQAVVDFYAPDSIPPGQFYNFRTLPAHWSSRHTTYWQHPDHLGSASWVTDTNGQGYQHLQYRVWGEPFIDQRTTANGYETRYTFSGKERDEETGYSYFGARHYNSDLSIWLSVDPMSDKYPSTSPYTYCGNNPVKLVDPNGREIWIVAEDGNMYQYVNGILYTDDWEACPVVEGTFEESVMNNLDVLRSTKTGGRIIRDLETCEKKITISDAKNRSDEPGKNGFILTGTITWNSDDGVVRTTKGNRIDPIANLGHELVHAHDMYVEKISNAKLNEENDHCPIGEWRAVYYENRMRKELGLPYRTGYTSDQKKGDITFPYYTRMLDSFNHPVKCW